MDGGARPSRATSDRRIRDMSGHADERIRVHPSKRTQSIPSRAARHAHCLASINAEIGDLDKITRIVTLFGMVNSAPRSDQQPAGINGRLSC
jgi:hypothetical protein